MPRQSLVGAVILAAGTSSRMGKPKPLLPLGKTTAIERVVAALRAANVEQIVIVTGQDSPGLAALIAQLDLCQVVNPNPERGMLFSAALGAAVLPGQLEAFFVWPADCALARASVLCKLLDRFFGASPGRPAVVRPCCLGRHGHPPLLAGALRDRLAALARSTCSEFEVDFADFRAFLARYAGQTLDVETEDISILLDMDTPEDYARLQRFVRLLDKAPAMCGEAKLVHNKRADSRWVKDGQNTTVPGEDAAAAGQDATVLDEIDCLYLHELLRTPKPVRRHCLAVARIGVSLGKALAAQGILLDIPTIRCACLLHDLAKHRSQKGSRGHARQAANMLRNLGLAGVADIVESHMVMPELAATARKDAAAILQEQLADNLPLEVPAPPAQPFPLTERDIVFVADVLVIEDRVATVNEKVAWAVATYQDFPRAVERAYKRARTARKILERLAPFVGDLERPDTITQLLA